MGTPPEKRGIPPCPTFAGSDKSHTAKTKSRNAANPDNLANLANSDNLDNLDNLDKRINVLEYSARRSPI